MHLIWPLSPLSDSSCPDDGVTDVIRGEEVKFFTDDKVGEKGFASADRVVSSIENDRTGVVSIPEGAREEEAEDAGLDLQVFPVSGICNCDCLDVIWFSWVQLISFG